MSNRAKQLLFVITLPIIFLSYYYLHFENWYTNAIPPESLQTLEWDLPPLSNIEKAKLNDILNQTFQYLDEGGQSYVYVSADNEYVLKFFKFHRFQTQWFIPYIPNLPTFSSYKENHITRRRERLNAVYTGHLIAYIFHQEESGLQFVQLIPSHKEQSLTVINKQGHKQIIDLGKVAYVVQKKGEMLSTIFSRLLDNDELDAVKGKIVQTLALYRSEYLKGLYDTDHGVMHNIGFVGEQPIHLDVGNFVKDSNFKLSAFYKNDLIKVANKIVVWVEKNYPQYHKEIAAIVKEELYHL